jgi:hypothetical protein
VAPDGYRYIGYDGTTPSQISGATVSGLGGYKVYTALLTQSGAADPIANVLSNTIGNIVWTRSGNGQYIGTLSGAFVTDKTVIFIQDNVTLSSIAISPRDVYIERQSANVIGLYTMDSSNFVDGVLNKTSIEIRVYL